MLKYVLAGLLSLCVVAACGADHKSDHRTLTVNGEGSAVVSPDIAHVYVAVVTEADTVSKAMTSNKTAMNNVFAVLTKAEIPGKDICTHSFTVSPKFKYVKDEEPKVVGHVVRNDLKVTVKNLDKVGSLLDSLTADGRANAVSGVVFDVSDKTKVTDEAREAAVKDALRRAKLIADASGVKLGKVLTINEGSVQYPRLYAADNVRSLSESTPVARGEQTFKASVGLVIQLAD